MNQWISISLIALVLGAGAAVYLYGRKPLLAAPESAGQKFLAFLWMYFSAFIITTIAWGLIDALRTGYCLAC